MKKIITSICVLMIAVSAHSQILKKQIPDKLVVLTFFWGIAYECGDGREYFSTI